MLKISRGLDLTDTLPYLICELIYDLRTTASRRDIQLRCRRYARRVTRESRETTAHRTHSEQTSHRSYDNK